MENKFNPIQEPESNVKPVSKWNRAAVEGVKLAIISIVLMLAASLTQSKGLGAVIWIVKLVATISFLWWAMKRYSVANAAVMGQTPYSDSFTFGFITSFLSSIVLAVYTYVNCLFINPEQMQLAKDAYMTQLESRPEVSMEVIEKVFDNLEIISTFGVLIIYTLFGLIISAILAGSTKVLPEGFNNN